MAVQQIVPKRRLLMVFHRRDIHRLVEQSLPQGILKEFDIFMRNANRNSAGEIQYWFPDLCYLLDLISVLKPDAVIAFGEATVRVLRNARGDFAERPHIFGVPESDFGAMSEVLRHLYTFLKRRFPAHIRIVE